MHGTASLDHLLTQYHTLCQYCDEVFARTLQTLGAYMQCAPGCASCCILETVTPLEASVIEHFLQENPIPMSAPLQERPETCIFLRDNACTIYAVRPVICRTHGLPLLYPERGEIEVCPLNFTTFDLTSLDSSSFLNAERITANLIRLNLAFCMLTAQAEHADERIPLRSILID